MEDLKSVVLLSGGIDSAVAFLMALDTGSDVYPLFVQYGQRHTDEELEAALSLVATRGTHSLDVINVEIPADNALIRKEEPIFDTPTSVVPMRNTIFLSLAAAAAVNMQAHAIWIGASKDDYDGYRDCRIEFFGLFQGILNEVCRIDDSIIPHLEIPLLHMTKVQIILKGTELELNFNKTWSCYSPQYRFLKNDTEHEKQLFACGTCPACKLRQESFSTLGMLDTINYITE